MSIGQTQDGVSVTVDQRLAPWLTDPNAAAATEATALYANLLDVKDDSTTLANELTPPVKAIQDAQASIASKAQAINALKSQLQVVQTGLGQAKTIEELMASAQSASSLAISRDEKLAEKMLSAQQAVYDPQAYQLVVNERIAYFRKKAARRANSNDFMRGINVLDTYVPGWTSLLDLVIPVPFVGTIIDTVLTIFVRGAVTNILAPGISLGTHSAAQVAQSSVTGATAMSSPITTVLGRIPFTIAKGTDTYIKTKGDFTAKIMAVTTEAMSGLEKVLFVAAIVVSAGTTTPALAAAFEVIQAAFSALKSTVSVYTAAQASKALHDYADALRKAAAEEVARLNAQSAAMDAEIRELQARIAALKAQRSAPTSSTPQRSVSPREADNDTAIMIGGLVLLGVAAVVIANRRY